MLLNIQSSMMKPCGFGGGGFLCFYLFESVSMFSSGEWFRKTVPAHCEKSIGLKGPVIKYSFKNTTIQMQRKNYTGPEDIFFDFVNFSEVQYIPKYGFA